ncbi:MAG TPA: glycoside hydrolase N-terminal domain-containing protein [Candidatus Paceibacterota bacterium]|nr:glycoside hydrolase N-terminal domain-containing protein [Candidatus Paceibacterota bacterium]
MKPILIALLLSAAFLPLSEFAAAPAAVDGPLTIWFLQPARNWNEALPLGNLRLNLDLPGNAEGYRRKLDLRRDIATVRFRCGGTVFTRECFISHPDGVLVMRITASEPGKVSFTAGLDSIYPNQVRAEKSGRLVLEGQWHEDGKRKDWIATWSEPGIRYATALQVKSDGGTIQTGTNTLQIQGTNSVILCLAAGTSFRNFRDISGDPDAKWPGQLRRAVKMGYEKLRDRHVKEFQGFMDRVALDLGGADANQQPTDERLKAVKAGADDPALAALYFQFGRYLMLSSSRPGSQPANLQGIWNRDDAPAWGSKYTVNINLQMYYWPAEVANLSEWGLPVYDMIDDLRITGSKVARDYYGCGGWTVHHSTDLWRGAAPVDGVWGVWPMGAAWMVRQAWEHYQFTQDKKFLRARAWAMVTRLRVICICSWPIPRCRTCSTTVRRSRLTATSAAARALLKCCCRVMREKSPCSRRYPRLGRPVR